MRFKCGHPKTPENSYNHSNNTGSTWLSCKVCKKSYSKNNIKKNVEYLKKYRSSPEEMARSIDLWLLKSRLQYENGKVWVISKGRP